MELTETPSPATTMLVTGHLREGPDYTTWRPKGTQDWLLIYTLSGTGRFGSEEGDFFADQGEVVLLRPSTLHDYGTAPTATHWNILWAHFHPRPHWFSWLEWVELAPGLMKIRIEDEGTRTHIEHTFSLADTLARGALRRKEDFAMNALENVLLWCDMQNPLSEQARVDSRVQTLMDFMCHRISEDISLAQLAEASGLSVSRMAHLFRAHMGITPLQFLEQQRMERATQLLSLTNRSIKSIAEEVGFENPFYFSSRFRQNVGVSPRDYRLKQQRERS